MTESSVSPVATHSERAVEVWESVVIALQGVVREHRITQDELKLAANYLTRLAAAGVARSLLDVALSMASLDAGTPSRRSTRANPEGPYYRSGAPIRPDGRLTERPANESAEQLVVRGQVTDAITRTPIPGAELDIWQADEAGNYDARGFHLRGRVRAYDFGRYQFTTIVPEEYTEHDDDPVGELFRLLGRHNYRAGHIHVKVHVAGHEALTTQLYMADATHLKSDYIEGAVTPDLILPRQPRGEATSVASFDFRIDLPAEQ